MSDTPRREVCSWDQVERLVQQIVHQLRREVQLMVIVTRGGLVPGGMLAEALGVKAIMTAAVQFPLMEPKQRLLAWPDFLQFPPDELLARRQILVVDDVWGSGRTITAVRERIIGAGGDPELCVLHFNPYRNLFGKAVPDYYGARTDAHIIYPWEPRPGLHFALTEPEATS